MATAGVSTSSLSKAPTRRDSTFRTTLFIGLAVAAGTFVVAQTLLPRLHGTPPANEPPADPAVLGRVLLASNLLLSALAAWAAITLRGLIAALRSPSTADPVSIAARPRLFLTFFTPTVAVLLAWWLGEWPGHMMTDEAHMFQRVSAGEAFPWLSTSFSVYAITIVRTLHSFTAVSFVNCIIIAAVIADVLSLLVHTGLRLWIAATALLVTLTSVPLGMLAISLSHDILSASLKLCLVAIITRCVVRSKITPGVPAPLATVVHATMLALIGATLRGENLALLLIVPALLWRCRAIQPLRATVYAAALIALFMLWNGPITRAISKPEPHRASRYSLTLLINPMGFYLANGYWSPTPGQDLEALARVVDLNDLRTLHSPYDIDVYWIGASKGDVTPEEMQDVMRVFIRASIDNPGLFIASRVATFTGMLGMTSRTNVWFYEGRERNPVEAYTKGNPPMQLAFDAGLRWGDHPTLLSRTTHAIRDWSYPRGARSPGFWIWNAWTSLLVVVVAIAMKGSAPRTALVACVIAAPLALVALAAPASHFKYIYDLYVSGLLLVPVWCWERSVTRRQWVLPIN